MVGIAWDAKWRNTPSVLKVVRMSDIKIIQYCQRCLKKKKKIMKKFQVFYNIQIHTEHLREPEQMTSLIRGGGVTKKFPYLVILMTINDKVKRQAVWCFIISKMEHLKVYRLNIFIINLKLVPHFHQIKYNFRGSEILNKSLTLFVPIPSAW